MSASKALIYLAIVAVTIAITQVTSAPHVSFFASNNTNKSHHLIVGSRAGGDKLKVVNQVVKNSSWQRIVVVERTLNVSQWERITQVRALDQKVNGNGAFASLTGGGPGYNYVSLRFKSQRSHGINFVVEIYAR